MKKLKYYLKRMINLNYKNFFKTINKISIRSSKLKILIFFDIIICSIKYMSGYVDYDLFNFEKLTGKQRRTFITRGINNEYIKVLNNSKYYDKFDNKITFNKIFKNFIKRDFIDLSTSSYEEFNNFIKRNKTFIAKPVNSSGGFGIEKIEIDKSTNLKILFERLLKDKKYLLEEFIIQSKAMNDLFPYSVNTLRIVTIRKEKEIKVIHRVIRIGNKDNVVDNFHNGGMYSIINEYGIVEKPAIDRDGNVFSYHPVTKHKIEGLIIDNFKEIENFAMEAAEVIPEVGYVGWDIALTDKGPVMIEGNNLPGYDLYQSKLHLNKDNTGMKPKFDEVIYGKKYKRDNRFFFLIALWVCKITKLLLKLRKKKIPYFPGNIAMKICPNYLYYLSKPDEIISITGTNGKSTVCKMLIDFFNSINIKTINNEGFNTVVGITSFLTDSVSLFNKQKSKIAIIETDELSSKKIYKNIHPDYIVVTNIFRDSIKKNANPEFIRDILKDSIPRDSKLILNADDLLCISLGNKNSIYFGINKLEEDESECNNLVCDAPICPKCSSILDYEFIKYHHIGKFKCNVCGFTNPKCEYEISKVNYEKQHFILNGEIYNFIYPNIPNLYNALASISLLKEMNYPYKTINENFKNIKILDTRFSKEKIKGKNIITIMAKGQNPIAVSSVLNLIKKDSSKKDIIMIMDDVNDKKDSCETISWIYDSDFEFLNTDSINKIIIGGKRSKDYLVRLLIAGIDKNKIITVDKEEDTVKFLDVQNIQSIYVLHDIFAYSLAKDIKKNIYNKIRGVL